MPYAQRDNDGKIVALHSESTDQAEELISASDPEVMTFLQQSGSGEVSRQFLDTTDSELVRVIEDLIALLVDKNLLLFTELPQAAQQKLINRRRARDTLADDDSVMIGREDVL